MIIFVTDEGRYWNHENPILERYSDCVVVVCLNGEQVTDKYRCVVSPYKHVGLGMTDYSVLSNKFQALQSIRKELRRTYSYHDDLVFLSDAEPQSLYPYLVLKDDEKYNRMHLWCMASWEFEGKYRIQAFSELICDIDKLTSIHYVDANEYLKLIDNRVTLSEMIENCREWLNSMLPGALYEIDTKLRWGKRYYYDLRVKRYISTDDSYSKILKVKPLNQTDIDNYTPTQMISTLGLLCIPSYPDSDDDTKAIVEQLHPRIDGKQVCEKLKRMRKQLAEENDIKLEIVDCPSTGPCAGTCQRCDMEIRYLQEQLMKKKETERIYSYTELKTKRKGKTIQLNRKTRTDVLMGVPIPLESEANVTTELVIPEFLKKRVDKMGGETNE